VAKKNTHTHTQTHSRMGLRGDGKIDSEFRRENRCEWVWLVEENKWNCEWSTLLRASCCFIIDKFWFVNTRR